MTNRILQSGCVLRNSVLWELQRRYYAHNGPLAWKKVPYNITSNMFIANQYAYWAAMALKDATDQGVLDVQHPVYLLELGAGHGRFGAYFTQRLDVWLERMGMHSALKYVYVLSDSARGNVDFWKQHPYWKKRIEQGQADVTRFDVENQKTIFLEQSQKFLDTLHNPLMVVSNYLFDTISHDVFMINKGQVWDCETVVSTEDDTFNEQAPASLDALKVSFSPHQKNSNPYENPVWNRVVHGLAEGIQEGAMVFPCGSLKVLETLQALSPHGMFVFAADKGHASIEPMKGGGFPNMAAHGSFSWMVNFPALAAYVSALGGSAAVKQHGGSFVLSAFAYGLPTGLWWQSVLKDVAHVFGADDFFILKRDIQKNTKNFKPDSLLAALRLSVYDPDQFVALSQAWIDQPQASFDIKTGLLEAVKKVEEAFYAMPASKDCLIEIGRIYHMFEFFEEASRFYHQSIRHFGESWAIYFNLGLCAYALNNKTQALAYWKKAKEINPEEPSTLEYVGKLEQGLDVF